MNKPLRLLIIQTAFLGDVILALPMLQAIKSHLPEARTDFLCVPGNLSVISNNPYVENVLGYDKKGKKKLSGFFKMLSEIRKNKYDIVITPHRFLRSALLTYFSGAKVRIGFNRNTFSFLLTAKAAYGFDKHEIQRNIDLIRKMPGIDFNESKVTVKPDLFPSDEDNDLVNGLLTDVDTSKMIAFAPCSRWVTKQFPLHKSVDVISSLIKQGFHVVLIGGNEDREYCRRVENRLMMNNFTKLCGKLSPVQSYIVIKKSRLLITVDSAAQHLGAAAGVPIVLIYGSTNSSFGFYPLQSEHRIMEISGLACRPCTDHGRNICPLGHFKCMEDIQAENILETVKNLTEKNKEVNG